MRKTRTFTNKRQAIAVSLMTAQMIDWIAFTAEGDNMSKKERKARERVMDVLEEAAIAANEWEEATPSA